MNIERIQSLLEHVRDGTTDVAEAVNDLKSLPFEDLGFARIDHHRLLRRGFPEVILCEGKTIEQEEQTLRLKQLREDALEKRTALVAQLKGGDHG